MTKTPVKKPAKSAQRKADARNDPQPRVASSDDALPDAVEIAAMLEPVQAFAADGKQARIHGFMARLAARPPQVLLLEGGTADTRLAAAHYWMLLLNCDLGAFAGSAVPMKGSSTQNLGLPGLSLPDPTPEQPDKQDANPSLAPCMECPACIRMISHLHRDCFFFDGTAGSIKIDEVRALRGVLGEPPREARFRMVVFREAQALGEAAANSLLKSFEEPRPHTSFLMLTPQRERLLPTLVSRSMTLTLPWLTQEVAAEREALASWEAALCTFLRTGRDFFERSGVKGTVDAPLAHAVANMCRRSLSRCIRARQSGGEKDATTPREGLEDILSRLPEVRMRMLDEALAECQDSLNYGVNPALVLEWLATRMYLLLPRK